MACSGCPANKEAKNSRENAAFECWHPAKIHTTYSTCWFFNRGDKKWHIDLFTLRTCDWFTEKCLTSSVEQPLSSQFLFRFDPFFDIISIHVIYKQTSMVVDHSILPSLVSVTVLYRISYLIHLHRCPADWTPTGATSVLVSHQLKVQRQM